MILNLFSRRQKQLRGDVPDVYRYDELPIALRRQVIVILRDTYGHVLLTSWMPPLPTDPWIELRDALRRERGVYVLNNNHDAIAEVAEYFEGERDVELALDVVEVGFRIAEAYSENQEYCHYANPRMTAPEAIEELNGRFRQHGIGYQYEGQLVRVDSAILHAEVVKPALLLLSGSPFVAADGEFRRAHEHYRCGRFEECLVDCLKAFESVMKVICSKRGWPLTGTETAKPLIDICLQNGVVPLYVQTELTAFRATLESAVPTVRNKAGGHGAGTTPRQVPRQVAAYLLHMTAANILLLVEGEKAIP